jgi:hypothetical protein
VVARPCTVEPLHGGLDEGGDRPMDRNVEQQVALASRVAGFRSGQDRLPLKSAIPAPPDLPPHQNPKSLSSGWLSGLRPKGQ